MSDEDKYVILEDDEGRKRAIPDNALQKMLREPVTFSDEAKRAVARDTQFAGFAILLLRDLYATGAIDSDTTNLNGEEIQKRLEAIIARRAYDLVCHFVKETNYGLDTHTVEDAVRTIPDMTKWPEESSDECNTDIETHMEKRDWENWFKERNSQ